MSKKPPQPPRRNPVAKYAARLQRPATFRDRTQYRRHGKHKGREPYPVRTALGA